MWEGIVKTVDGLSETLNSVNPLVDGFKPIHEDMINTLMQNGYTGEQILSLIDVERSPAKEYIDVTERALKIVAEMQATKKTSRGTRSK